MKRALLSILTSLLLLLALTGCAAAPSGGSVTEFTDMTGHTTLLPDSVERVVALTASDCEILYAIGAGELLVGRGEYCDFPAEILDLPVVQSGANTNLEQIIALEPQVVFLNTMAQTIEQNNALETAGIAVVAGNARSIDEVYLSIETIGRAVKREDAANEVVSRMKSGFQALAEKVTSAGERPTVYFEVSPLEYGLWTAGTDTFMDEIAALLGLENAFPDLSGWGEVSQEQVIQRNPDYIVSIAMYYGEGPRPEEEIASRPGWEGIQAIREGRVLLVDSDAISRPGPRLLEAAEALYGLIYG